MSDLPKCVLKDYREWEVNGYCLYKGICDAKRESKKELKNE